MATRRSFHLNDIELMPIFGMSKCLRLKFRLPHVSVGGRSLALTPLFCTYYTYPPLGTNNSRRVMLPSPLTRLTSIQRHFTMNTLELKNFLADSPPSAVNLVIKKHFEALTDQQARYAHYISRYVALLQARKYFVRILMEYQIERSHLGYRA